MTLDEFNALPHKRQPQLVAVLGLGTFLAQRWEDEAGINLCR